MNKYIKKILLLVISLFTSISAITGEFPLSGDKKLIWTKNNGIDSLEIKDILNNESTPLHRRSNTEITSIHTHSKGEDDIMYTITNNGISRFIIKRDGNIYKAIRTSAVGKEIIMDEIHGYEEDVKFEDLQICVLENGYYLTSKEFFEDCQNNSLCNKYKHHPDDCWSLRLGPHHYVYLITLEVKDNMVGEFTHYYMKEAEKIVWDNRFTNIY